MTDQNPASEARRLQELREFEIIDTEEEQEFDDLVELASDIAGMPISLISLLDESRQWFKARKGIQITESSRTISFCNTAIQYEGAFIINDVQQDERFRNNPFVTGAEHIRFYAGFPLVTPAGNKLGTLCIMDQKPGTLSQQKARMLEKLASKAVALMELRRKNKEMAALKAAAEAQRDITDQLLANQRKMMAILAHDTRGPLVSMSHLVETIRAHADDAVLRDMALELIGGQLKVTLELIDNLIAWGASQLSAQMYEEQQYDPACVAQEAFRSLAHTAQEKEIAFSVFKKPDTVFWVNRDMLRFMLRNLLHNAVKFTDKGSVSVNLHEDEFCSIIEVADTGVGMPAGTRNNLFGRKLTSREGTRKEPGSGLGLLLVNDFIVKLGGSIDVASTEGTGTRFVIRFPKKLHAPC